MLDAVQIDDLIEMDGEASVLVLLHIRLRREEAVILHIILLRHHTELVGGEGAAFQRDKEGLRFKEIDIGGDDDIAAAGIALGHHEDRALDIAEHERPEAVGNIAACLVIHRVDAQEIIILLFRRVQIQRVDLLFAGGRDLVQQDVLCVQIQAIGHLGGIVAVLIDDAGAHRLHDIFTGEDVVLAAAGQRSLIAAHGHHKAVPLLPDGQHPEPVGVVEAVGVIDIAEADGIPRPVGGFEVKNEPAFIEGRIAGAEVAVKHGVVAHDAGQVQPVFRHAVVLAVEIHQGGGTVPCFRGGGGGAGTVRFVIRAGLDGEKILLLIGEENRVSDNLLEQIADRQIPCRHLFGGEHVGPAAVDGDDAPVRDHIAAADGIAVVALAAGLAADRFLFGSGCHPEVGILAAHVVGEFVKEGLVGIPHQVVDRHHHVGNIALRLRIDIIIIPFQDGRRVLGRGDFDIPVDQGIGIGPGRKGRGRQQHGKYQNHAQRSQQFFHCRLLSTSR